MLARTDRVLGIESSGPFGIGGISAKDGGALILGLAEGEDGGHSPIRSLFLFDRRLLCILCWRSQEFHRVTFLTCRSFVHVGAISQLCNQV